MLQAFNVVIASFDKHEKGNDDCYIGLTLKRTRARANEHNTNVKLRKIPTTL